MSNKDLKKELAEIDFALILNNNNVKTPIWTKMPNNNKVIAAIFARQSLTFRLQESFSIEVDNQELKVIVIAMSHVNEDKKYGYLSPRTIIRTHVFLEENQNATTAVAAVAEKK